MAVAYAAFMCHIGITLLGQKFIQAMVLLSQRFLARISCIMYLVLCRLLRKGRHLFGTCVMVKEVLIRVIVNIFVDQFIFPESQLCRK